MTDAQPQNNDINPKKADDPGKSGEAQLRTDGPTPEEWVKAGYDMKNYPPQGYAAKEAGSAPAADGAAKKDDGATASTAPANVPDGVGNVAAEPGTKPAPKALPVPAQGASVEERLSSLEQVVHAQVGHVVGAATAETHGMLYRWWEDMKAFFESL